MLDNECIVRYLLSIENKELDTIAKMKFKIDNYSFDELFKYSKYYPNIENYIDYIKSKICVKCKETIENECMKLPCRCYECKKCYGFIEMTKPGCCPICRLNIDNISPPCSII